MGVASKQASQQANNIDQSAIIDQFYRFSSEIVKAKTLDRPVIIEEFYRIFLKQQKQWYRLISRSR